MLISELASKAPLEYVNNKFKWDRSGDIFVARSGDIETISTDNFASVQDVLAYVLPDGLKPAREVHVPAFLGTNAKTVVELYIGTNGKMSVKQLDQTNITSGYISINASFIA